MKIDLEITGKPDGTGWTVELWENISPDNDRRFIGKHDLTRLKVGSLTLPVPPEANRVALPTSYTEIWTNPNQTAALFRNLFARLSQAGLVETVGLYLFACLIGPGWWQKIQADLKPDDTLELRLNLSDPDLARLPWETLRVENQFLLSRKQFNMYRCLLPRPDANDPPAQLELPLRVLFVIAAELDDPEINAASEYLSLLRRLQENEGLPLEIKLLSTLNGPEAATFEAMQRTIKLFQPHVLHLVAHGGLDGGRAYLRFPVENRGEDGRRDAANLEAALSGMNLQAVILNACYSGQALGSNGSSNPGLSQQNEINLVKSSIAVRLVEAGVPFVVGMNGKVADQVCRLFAREFYVSLAEGKSVPEATARGRRAGLSGQYQAEQKLDWALPVLFMPRDGQERLSLKGRERVRDLDQLAREVIPPRRPDFCDRLNFLQAFQNLLLESRPKMPALALYTNGPDGRGLGKTRLLEEMGSIAVRAGHFACVIPAEEKLNFRDYLTRTVALNIEQTAERWFPREPFLLKQLDLTLKALSRQMRGDELDPELTDRVKNILRLGVDERRGVDEQIERRALVAALCKDLVDLAERLGPGKQVILLFDDVHKIGTALPFFHNTLLEKGFYTVSDRVRVVFAFDSVPSEQPQTAQDLYLYAQQSQWINLMPVTTIPAEEEALAYRQYVLRRNPPLVDVGSRDELYLFFQRYVQGRPGNLLGMEKDAIPFLLQINALAEAKDKDLLIDDL